MADHGAPVPIATEPGKVRFTGEQVLAMQATGVLPSPNRIELIDGELLDMGSEGDRHGNLKARLTTALARLAPTHLTIGPDTTLRLADNVWPEPDIFVFAASQRPAQVRGPDALLVVEISDTSLAYDLKEKAALYARYGVREYWVVEAETGRCHVHQSPQGEGWRLVRTAAPDEAITASLVSEIVVRMADFA